MPYNEFTPFTTDTITIPYRRINAEITADPLETRRFYTTTTTGTNINNITLDPNLDYYVTQSMMEEEMNKLKHKIYELIKELKMSEISEEEFMNILKEG